MADIPGYLTKYRVTNTWAQHRARGSAGGVDFATPTGTPWYAPSAGYLDFRIVSDGSSVVRVRRADGSATEFFHGRMTGSKRNVTAGELIGTSDGRKGTYGAGPSTGPHTHVHDVTAAGARVYPFSTVPSGSGAGGGALAANQRRSSTVVKRRLGAPSISAPASEESRWLQAGVVGTFVGWIRGDSVDGNNVWFKGTSGDYFWSGAFEGGANTAGLADLNAATPPPVSSNQRIVGVNPAKRRIGGPGTNFPASEEERWLKGGEIANLVGWVNGEVVQGNGVWFKGTSGDYFWSGGFTDPSTTGLPDLNGTTPPITPPVTPPTLTLDPAQPWKTGTPDSPLATWYGSPNYGYRESGLKDHITLHWMDGTLAGTDATFQNPGEISKGFSVRHAASPYGRGTNQSTQYGIGVDAIHQYVPENEYAHGDGNAISNATGISIEHQGGTSIPIAESTYALSAKLCADIAKRHGWTELVWMENVFPHKHWAATSCPGTLDTARIIREANAILNPVVIPEPDTLAGKIKLAYAELGKLINEL